MASLIDSLLLKVKNRRMVMMLAPIIVGLFLGVQMVVRPSMAKMAAVQAQKHGLSKKVNMYNQIVNEETRLAEYKKQLAPIEDKTKTIEDLTTLAINAGLNISSVTPEEKRTVWTYMERVLVRIDAEGGYHELGDFVGLVENMQPFVKILNVSISPAAAKDSGPLPIGSAGAAANRNKKVGGDYRLSVGVGLFYGQKDML